MVRTRQSTLLQDCFTADLRLHRLPRLNNSKVTVTRCHGITRLVVGGEEDIPDYRLRTKKGKCFYVEWTSAANGRLCATTIWA